MWKKKWSWCLHFLDSMFSVKDGVVQVQQPTYTSHPPAPGCDVLHSKVKINFIGEIWACYAMLSNSIAQHYIIWGVSTNESSLEKVTWIPKGSFWWKSMFHSLFISVLVITILTLLLFSIPYIYIYIYKCVCVCVCVCASVYKCMSVNWWMGMFLYEDSNIYYLHCDDIGL